MVCARKALIHAGLRDFKVSQSYLDNLIETCPQITRNQVVGQPAREFESHRLRHEPVCGQYLQQAFPFPREVIIYPLILFRLLVYCSGKNGIVCCSFV